MIVLVLNSYSLKGMCSKNLAGHTSVSKGNLEREAFYLHVFPLGSDLF